MAAGFLDTINSDLQAVEAIINKAFKIKPGFIGNFARIDDDYPVKHLHPAVIILTGRMFGLYEEKLYSLAAIIQFIYLAANVHFRIPDYDPDPAETDMKDGVQYPVLVGDYLYGRFFTTLCKGQIIHLLEPLADIICEMNVGGILRTQNYQSREEKLVVIEKESASLLREGCRLTGSLAGVSAQDLDNIGNFGYNIGMGYGMLERNFPLEEAQEYFNRARDILLHSFSASKARDTLLELVQSLIRGETKVKLKKYGPTLEQAGNKKDINDPIAPPYYENKEEYVHDIFSKIAGKYDFLNTVLSINRDKYWRKFAVVKTGLKPGGRALDVCCGTGMLTLELAKVAGPVGKVVGLDFCGDMLKIAGKKITNTPYIKNIEFVQGNAMDLPFPDNYFDCATIGFGLRNVPDMRQAIREMMRVVKPGGRVVSLEFAKPTVPGFRKIYNFYFRYWVPFLGKLGVGVEGPYNYLHKSWTVFPHQKEVRDIFEEIGLSGAEYFELTGGVVAVHVGVKPATNHGTNDDVAVSREER